MLLTTQLPQCPHPDGCLSHGLTALPHRSPPTLPIERLLPAASPQPQCLSAQCLTASLSQCPLLYSSTSSLHHWHSACLLLSPLHGPTVSLLLCLSILSHGPPAPFSCLTSLLPQFSIAQLHFSLMFPSAPPHQRLMAPQCLTPTAHSSLLTAYCSQLTAHCSLLTAHCSQLTAHSSLLTAPLLTAHCSLLTAHCSQLTAHCPTVHSSLLTAHCLILLHSFIAPTALLPLLTHCYTLPPLPCPTVPLPACNTA
jgi:hypothetical protein